VTTRIPRFQPPPCSLARARAGAPARHARGRRARAPATAALLCLLALGLAAAHAASRKPRDHKDKPASAPSTEQILAPSAATPPDPLPPEQRIFRCGNSYSARPCAGADATPLHVADARSDAQRRQSEELAARDKRLAAWYEAGRHEREKIPSAPAAGRRTSAAPACVSTKTMTCSPKSPETRRVMLPAASSPALGKPR
jgi:hypothetical protein